MAPSSPGGYRHLPMYSAVLTFQAAVFQLFALFGRSFEEFDAAGRVPGLRGTIVPPAKPVLGWCLSVLAAAAGIGACVALGLRILDRAGKRVGRFTGVAAICSTIQSVFSLFVAAYYFDSVRPIPAPRRLGENFFSLLEGGLLALISLFLLAIDYAWTDSFKHAGSGFSPTQRRTVAWVVLITLYSSALSLVFAYIEEWSFRASTFFVLTTITTIGFGAAPHVPANPASRIIVMLSAGIGIGMVAATVRSISDVIDEGIQEGVKLRWRIRRGGKDAGYRRLTRSSSNGSIDDPPLKQSWLPRLRRPRSDPSSFSATDLELGTGTSISELPPSPSAAGSKPSQHTQSLSALSPNYTSRFFLSTLSLVTFWSLSSATFYVTEPSWSLLDAFYFSFIAFTTIGYGDLTPTTSASLAAFNLFVLVGIGVLTHFANASMGLARSWTDPEGVVRRLLSSETHDELHPTKTGMSGEETDS